MKTILVIEDEDVICELLCDILQDENYKVLSAAHGAEGWALLEKTKPDLVLSDLMMPILNGQEFCEAMQADPRFQNIPIIIISAVEAMINREVCDYAALVAKPFDVNKLVETINQVISA